MYYSVWNYSKKAYDYYVAPGEEPPTGSFRTPVGGLDFPERAATLVPADALPAGSGRYAKGLVAVTNQGLARLLAGQATSAVDGSGNTIQGLGDVGVSERFMNVAPWLAAVGTAIWIWRRSGS